MIFPLVDLGTSLLCDQIFNNKHISFRIMDVEPKIKLIVPSLHIGSLLTSKLIQELFLSKIDPLGRNGEFHAALEIPNAVLDW